METNEWKYLLHILIYGIVHFVDLLADRNARGKGAGREGLPVLLVKTSILLNLVGDGHRRRAEHDDFLLGCDILHDAAIPLVVPGEELHNAHRLAGYVTNCLVHFPSLNNAPASTILDCDVFIGIRTMSLRQEAIRFVRSPVIFCCAKQENM